MLTQTVTYFCGAHKLKVDSTDFKLALDGPCLCRGGSRLKHLGELFSRDVNCLLTQLEVG